MFIHCFLFLLHLKEICTKILRQLDFGFMKGSVVRPNLGGGLAEPPNMSKTRGSAEPNVRCTPNFDVLCDFYIFSIFLGFLPKIRGNPLIETIEFVESIEEKL